MNGFDLDLRRLRPSLVIFGLSLLLAGGLIAASHFYKTAREEALHAEEARLRSLESGYLQAVRDRQAILTHYPRFKQLRAQGFLGADSRLLWVEEIRETALAARVLGAHYRLNESSQQTVAMDLDTGSYQLYGDPMSVRLELAHEGDLLSFLDLLDARRMGVWDLERCHLVRLTPPGEPSLESANVQADCRLLWFNLRGVRAEGGTDT